MEQNPDSHQAIVSLSMVAFGKHFISNPDLVERLKRDAPLAQPNRQTFYGGDAEGYTDYPPMELAPA